MAYERRKLNPKHRDQIDWSEGLPAPLSWCLALGEKCESCVSSAACFAPFVDAFAANCPCLSRFCCCCHCGDEDATFEGGATIRGDGFTRPVGQTMHQRKRGQAEARAAEAARVDALPDPLGMALPASSGAGASAGAGLGAAVGLPGLGERAALRDLEA